MVGLSSLSLQVILCVLVGSSATSPAPRATTVPLPTPPEGSQVMYVAATDPGIVWSDGWQIGPSSCSSDPIRTVSGTGTTFDETDFFTASYSFRGSAIYANLQSGNASFAITVDGSQTTFGYGGLFPVPMNCSYDWSAQNLPDDIDHYLTLTTLGSSMSNNGFWTLSLDSLAIIQPGSSNASSGSSPNSSGPSPSTQSSSTGANPSPSPSSSAAGSGGVLSSTDIIAIVTSLIGGIASIAV
ncbi:hypothetical protein MSAN_02118100 [Mycena sanguinolenta]|uniref:Uncharacterized protein n=1 Tax=Mycena sanguinolenta TaxID=230812 RepID=A0A8H7CLX5_9AGAR|nr:hypothetical protein MSAN_02118100 [Mycena sanguinolenta]